MRRDQLKQRVETTVADLAKIFRGDHPFVSEPGTWIAAGHGMSGDPLDRIPIQGRVRISHVGGRIMNEGEMSVVSRSNPLTFQTSYELTPTGDPLVLEFYQENGSVGDLRGKVVAFDDRLVSSYISGDGSMTGCEVFHRMGDNRYAVTGNLLSNGHLMNLWKLDLVRPSTAGSEDEETHTGQG